MIPQEMRLATQWGSHLPPLLACIAQSTGPILEIGVGHFSTPHLHALCESLDRDLLSVEPDPEWMAQFRSIYHTRRHYFSTTIPTTFSQRFGAALIDHSPGGENRANAFRALLPHCDFIVMHDAQKDAENFKAVEPLLINLHHWILCTRYFPHTLVASATKELPSVIFDL